MNLKIKNIFLVIFFFSLVVFIYIKISETKKTQDITVKIPENERSN